MWPLQFSNIKDLLWKNMQRRLKPLYQVVISNSGKIFIYIKRT